MTDTATLFARRSGQRRPALTGGLIGLAFFGGLGGWAAAAPLAGAAIAPAVVAPYGSRKAIQHLEGGIVAAILVADGDRVEPGQPLLRLDDTRVRAEAQEVEARLTARTTTLARLAAERDGGMAPHFDADLLARAAADPKIAATLEAERRRLTTRAVALAAEHAVQERRAAQEAERITGLEATLAGYQEQARLLDEEIATVQRLVGKGLERRPRLLELQRSRSEVARLAAEARAGIGRAREAIAETRSERASLVAGQAAEVADELADAQAEIGELRQRLTAARDRLARAVITAPVRGTVTELSARTVGGVVAQGEVMMSLVPLDEALELEARVAPHDIDEVVPGLVAQVHLSAFRGRVLPRIDGVVRTVSADRVIDPETQEAYYRARVTVDRDQLEALGPERALVPGMPAEALILTRSRTTLDYLLAPITDVLRRGMTES